MKKWCAMCLVLTLVLGLFAGCRPSEEDMLEGKWTGKADLAEAYESMLAGVDPSVAGHIDIVNFQVELTLRFESDGTYRMRADEEDLRKGVENMMVAIRQGLTTYLQIETGKSMDNLLAASNTTMDELMAQYFDEDMFSVVRDSLESEGTYKVSGGKLTLTNKDGDKIFEGKYDVDEEDLKLKSGVTSKLIAILLPLTLEKD